MGTVINKCSVLNYGQIYYLKLNKSIFCYKLLHQEYIQEQIYVEILAETYSKEYSNSKYAYSHGFLVLLEYSATSHAKKQGNKPTKTLPCYISVEAVSQQAPFGNDISIRYQIRMPCGTVSSHIFCGIVQVARQLYFYPPNNSLCLWR